MHLRPLLSLDQDIWDGYMHTVNLERFTLSSIQVASEAKHNPDLEVSDGRSISADNITLQRLGRGHIVLYVFDKSGTEINLLLEELKNERIFHKRVK